MLCQGLHHVAYRCKDAIETVDFYTNVLGMKFTHARGDDYVPSTEEYSPHIHIFFEMADGSNVAFFECPKDKGEINGMDPQSPDWVQHLALRVESMETLLAAKERIESKGIEVLGPVDHAGFIQSIYLRDPSGHRLELTIQTATEEEVQHVADTAMDILKIWGETRDWSQRDRIYGQTHGYPTPS